MTDFTFCPYCKGRAVFRLFGHDAYPHPKDFGAVWICPKDGAYIGVLPGTIIPSGRLADKALREAKNTAHRAFDILWRDWRIGYPEKTKGGAALRRTMKEDAYAWLASQMGMGAKDCRISYMDVDQCYQVVDIIDKLRPTAATVRAWAKAKELAHET